MGEVRDNRQAKRLAGAGRDWTLVMDAITAETFEVQRSARRSSSRTARTNSAG